MKKPAPALEKEIPLPIDKPETYGNAKKADKKSISQREDQGKTKVKSDNDNPQKVREKLEYDEKKPEKDPGMTKR